MKPSHFSTTPVALCASPPSSRSPTRSIPLASTSRSSIWVKPQSRIGEAESVGVQSVPALVIGGQPFHINFGAAIADLK